MAEESTFRRYVLIQVPGWVLAAILLSVLYEWTSLPLWAAVLLWLLYVAKDFALYPLLRRAYEPSASGAELLVGETGTAAQPLAPEGYVRVKGELWRAELAPGAPPVPAGARVRVQAARGLTLVVRRDGIT